MTSVQDAIRVLNEALEAEPEAVQKIFALRVKTTGKLSDHPTIQIGPGDQISALGLINGIFGVRADDLYGYITGEFDEDGRVLRFVETGPVHTRLGVQRDQKGDGGA